MLECLVNICSGDRSHWSQTAASTLIHIQDDASGKLKRSSLTEALFPGIQGSIFFKKRRNPSLSSSLSPRTSVQRWCTGIGATPALWPNHRALR